MLTISYQTSRKEPLFWWFISSLRRQPGGHSHDIRIVVVDYWAQEIPHHDWGRIDVARRKAQFKAFMPDYHFLHIPPKPTPWQGPHRLTKNDYFAASNARNTALLYARDGHIAYVDDLSVLLPTWLLAVREACANNQITAGAFKKLKNIQVVDGLVKSFEAFPPGMDSRWLFLDKSGNTNPAPVECAPNWTFGCSIVFPIERLLEINGYPEDSDSTGVAGEDTAVGVALANRGHKIFYDRRMLTYESEEHHYQPPVMLRTNKKNEGTATTNGAEHPNHKDHLFVHHNRVKLEFENYFGPAGIRGLRDRVLRGQPIPATVAPTIDWFDKQPAKEL